MDDVYEPRYTCIVRRNNQMGNIPENAPSDGLIIEFLVRNRYENFYYSLARNLWVFHNITTGTRETTASYMATREHILANDADWEEDVSTMLLLFNIPSHAQAIMTREIKAFAAAMASDPAHEPPSLLPISVEITRWSCVDITDHFIQEETAAAEGGNENESSPNNNNDPYSDSEADEILAQIASLSLEEEEEENVRGPTPASREVVQVILLNNVVRVEAEAAAAAAGGGEEEEEEDDGGGCRICLEKFAEGMEAIQMPCNHLFHQDCILEWLKNSNVCPLCRFELPVAP